MIPTRDGKFRRKMRMDLSMGCENPFTYDIFARYSAFSKKKVKPYWIETRVRCRKCETCMENLRRFWAARALTEFHSAARTWLVTFTMAPDRQYMLTAETVKRLAETGIEFSGLDDAAKFSETARSFGYHVQLYLKRIRKALKVPAGGLRYMTVAEAHTGEGENSGRPHYHALFHEKSPGSLAVGDPSIVLTTHEPSGEMEVAWKRHKGVWVPGVRLSDTARLRTNWALGFTRIELVVSESQAVYSCKYLSKAKFNRIRASRGYGNTDCNAVENSVRLSPKAIQPQPKGLTPQAERT